MPFYIRLPNNQCAFPFEISKLTLIKLMNDRRTVLNYILVFNDYLIPKINFELELDNEIRKYLEKSERLYTAWRIFDQNGIFNLQNRMKTCYRIIGSLINKMNPTLMLNTYQSLSQHTRDCTSCNDTLSRIALDYTRIDPYNWPLDYSLFLENARLEGVYSFEKFYKFNQDEVKISIKNLL